MGWGGLGWVGMGCCVFEGLSCFFCEKTHLNVFEGLQNMEIVGYLEYGLLLGTLHADYQN